MFGISWAGGLPRKLAAFVLALILLAGCSGQSSVQGGGTASADELRSYQEKLLKSNDVFQAHKVMMLTSSTNEKEGRMDLEVRRIGVHDQPLPDQEMAAFKKAIYGAVGAEFPLAIKVFTIGQEPHMKGKVSKIDESGRLLIVSTEKYLDAEKKEPEADWYTMASDAELLYQGKPISLKDIKAGAMVDAWNEGLVLTSYPGQTTGLKLVVKSME